MYCAICRRFRFSILCKECLDLIWNARLRRELSNGLKVFSPFAYSELGWLLHSKDAVIGSRVFKILGRLGVECFFANYPALLDLKRDEVGVICIRNKRVGVYSHSAILARCFRRFGFKVFCNALISGNDLRFMRLSLEDRREASREFRFRPPRSSRICAFIIVDDVVTTGQTLLEASMLVESLGFKALFAWTLCDARA